MFTSQNCKNGTKKIVININKYEATDKFKYLGLILTVKIKFGMK